MKPIMMEIHLLDVALSKESYLLAIQLIKHKAPVNIEKAFDYITNISTVKILNKNEGVENKLILALNVNPLIAITQIDYLYKQIKSGNIAVPRECVFSKKANFFNKQKNQKEHKKAHDEILSILKRCYIKNVHGVHDHYTKNSDATHAVKKQNLLNEYSDDIIKKLSISKKIKKSEIKKACGNISVYKVGHS